MILSLCVVFMYCEINCIDNFFYGDIFQYLGKNIPLFIKILFLKRRIIWMLLRKNKLEILMNM